MNREIGRRTSETPGGTLIVALGNLTRAMPTVALLTIFPLTAIGFGLRSTRLLARHGSIFGSRAGGQRDRRNARAVWKIPEPPQQSIAVIVRQADVTDQQVRGPLAGHAQALGRRVEDAIATVEPSGVTVQSCLVSGTMSASVPPVVSGS